MAARLDRIDLLGGMGPRRAGFNRSPRLGARWRQRSVVVVELLQSYHILSASARSLTRVASLLLLLPDRARGLVIV